VGGVKLYSITAVGFAIPVTCSFYFCNQVLKAVSQKHSFYFSLKITKSVTLTKQKMTNAKLSVVLTDSCFGFGF
jgi:hypothetical protein